MQLAMRTLTTLVRAMQMGNELSTIVAATVLIRRAKTADAAALRH